MRVIPLFAALLASPVLAETWASRPGDQVLTRSALHARLNGQVLTFFDDGRSEYYADGRYTYTYANEGGTGYGYWRLEDDGVVCVDFVTGFSRCDRYVMNGNRLILQTEKGDRFPIRE